MRKIVFGLLAAIIVLTWPMSLVIDPPKFKTETIFYKIETEEQRLFLLKHGLDHSFIKRIFYNKYTIYKDRYLSNLGVFFDINNYFFKMHPREDASSINFRNKFPFWSVIFLIPGLMVVVSRRKIILVVLAIEGLVLACLKNFDGFDMVAYIPISLILFEGMNKIWPRK